MSQKPTCLVVDDENDLSELIVFTLQRMGVNAESAGNLDDAKFMLRQRNYDLCLTDMRLPDGNGLDLVKHVGQNHAGLPIAVITAFGSAENAVSALKTGAFDYITKPISLQQLRALVQSALKLSEQTEASSQPANIVGESENIVEIRNTIEKLASSQAPVLIHGEQGSGKELTARLIHASSTRRDNPFVKVSCGSITEKNIEKELFGYVAGSPSEINTGLFASANGGTLFLDEIADLPIAIQVKLLQVIQDKKLRPVGADKDELIDVRIISATHRNIQVMIEHGLFRQDLYYRINIVSIDMPALRDRSADIPLLSQHILQRLSKAHGKNIPAIEEQAVEKLINYDFFGNVRELENVLERALTLCDGETIKAENILLRSKPRPTPMNVDSSGMALPDYLENIEKQAILDALEKTKQNKTAAAKVLGISFRTLRYRLSKLGLTKDSEELDEQ
jgi:two-component system, NtrC family, response regulator PilR